MPIIRFVLNNVGKIRDITVHRRKMADTTIHQSTLLVKDRILYHALFTPSLTLTAGFVWSEALTS
jgi:hypothetical protein